MPKQNLSEQEKLKQNMFKKIDKINPFSIEMDILIDVIDSIPKKDITDEQFGRLSRSFANLKNDYKKKLIKKIKDVLEFANTIDNALSDYLYLEIQNKSREIDKINIAELIRVKEIEITKNNNNNLIKYNNLIKLWQSFFDLRNTYERKLGEKFKEMYQIVRTMDCNLLNKFQGIETRSEKINELSTIKLLTIYNSKYFLTEDWRLSLKSRQRMLNDYLQWVEMKIDFTNKYDIVKNENMLKVFLDKISVLNELYGRIEMILLNREIEKSKCIIRVNSHFNNDTNTSVVLQKLAINRCTDNFEKDDYFFEYHINHNEQTHKIDYTLYFDVCKVKYCLNKIGSDKGYPLKIGAIGSNGYNFSDLTRYRIGQYTLKEEQYKDIFLPMDVSYLYIIGCASFIKKEQIKRLLHSMYQINGGPNNIFIQLHDSENNNLSKGFAFANQKVIYFEEFINSKNKNKPYLKTIECNLMPEINNKEQFNKIFNYSGRWISDWRKVKKDELPNATILKIKKGIFRDMENIDFKQNENFKIAKITYPMIRVIMRDMDMEKAILRTLKGVRDADYTLKTIHSVPEGEYTCMDGTVIKGKNITNRIKYENDQLQEALAEFSFPGEKMAGL